MTKYGIYTVCHEFAVLQAEIYTNVHAKYIKKRLNTKKYALIIHFNETTAIAQQGLKINKPKNTHTNKFNLTTLDLPSQFNGQLFMCNSW